MCGRERAATVVHHTSATKTYGNQVDRSQATLLLRMTLGTRVDVLEWGETSGPSTRHQCMYLLRRTRDSPQGRSSRTWR